jgi:hypothetical protein
VTRVMLFCDDSLLLMLQFIWITQRCGVAPGSAFTAHLLDHVDVAMTTA